MQVADVRFEHHREPLGIGESRPRLSWKVRGAPEGWSQAAYEVDCSGDRGDAPWSSGRVASSESVLVPWPADPLHSRDRRHVRVRVWGEGERDPSDWSASHAVEAGLLAEEDWVGRFVSADWDEAASGPGPSPLLRREFELSGPVVSARLYATAQGVYELELNGQRVGDEVMAPGWTSYRHRLRYQTYDVTALVDQGPNALGAVLGDGWFRGRLGFHGGRRNVYGERLALLAQLEVRYADGSAEVLCTDATWWAGVGAILASEIYDGEQYDARLEQRGWALAGFDDRDWSRVVEREPPGARLVAPDGPPVRRTELIDPVSIGRTPAGSVLVDFGQNLVGRVRIRVRGEAGQVVTLRHAEVLEGGDLATRPLRVAEATDRYVLRGEGEEVWEPRFTFHGFRYITVDGWPGELDPSDLQAVVCHTDMERTGWFRCSDAMLEQLHDNVVWSMRGNFFDIPTDCPQRDERLGWTGDIQVFAPTAAFLYDCIGMLHSWLTDLALEQRDHGVPPHFVPYVDVDLPPHGTAAWSDAAVIVPWVLYERFDDPEILARQYDSMTSWVEEVDKRTNGGIWDQGFQFGDWLDPTASPHQPDDGKTDRHLVATAYHARSADLLARVAGVLGREADRDRYADLAAQVRGAFANEYVAPAGRVVSDSETAYVLALEFALLPHRHQRDRAARRLVELVESAGHTIGTGFVGTPLICDALAHAGRVDTAYRLLLQDKCPSWLYPVTMGATTVWERWDSMLPDGSVNPGEMTSFNHYALGAVADWLHRTVAGLAPAEPGYRKVLVAPQPRGGLAWAGAEHETPYGRVAVGWHRHQEGVRLTVRTPPGVESTVRLPSAPDEFALTPGSHELEIGSGDSAPRCQSHDGRCITFVRSSADAR